MVPLSLRLRNFMSYGDEPVEVDFDGWRLACLSGGNGNGKSALLDAMTWALWGRSRARREDDLVRQGATEMEVELCFAEAAGRFRILRKRTLRKSGGTATLELQALRDAGPTAITGATISQTQTRINDILKVSYDTFINSTFLLQGHADEFTIKPPAQRKAVLGEILGLEAYDRLAERSRERARDRAAKATVLRDSMKITEDDLARRPALRQELAGAIAQREVTARSLQAADAAFASVQDEQRKLQESEKALERIESELDGLQGEIATLYERYDTAQTDLHQAEAVLVREADIAAAADELRQVRAAAEEMGIRAAQAMEVERGVALVRQEIERDATRLGEELRAAAEEEARHRVKAEQGPALRRQLEEHEAAGERIPEIESRRAEMAKELQNLRDEFSTAQADSIRLRAELEPLRQRLKLLKEPGAACPICGAPMADGERERVYQQYTAEGVAKRARCEQHESRILELQAQIADHEKLDQQLVASIKVLQTLAREAGKLREQLQNALEAESTLVAVRARSDAASQALESEAYAPEARSRLKAALSDLAAVGYDSVRHAAVRDRIQELVWVEDQTAVLASARERRTAAEAAILHCNHDLERRRAQVAQVEQTAAELRSVLEALPLVERRLAECENEVKDCRVWHEQQDRIVATMSERLRSLDEQEERQRDRRMELAGLEREGDGYAELARIFGKVGIQAMIIDNALPELESRANDILTRMSDGTMQIRFDTQKAGTRNDVLETLDISIADASGTRPYEMFSGGEAFRANFAIRIALSRLLTTRAGGQLQMLVIDEGFGTQDGQGRDRLVDAINSIAPDFEKIIIITHIDELKDLFNVRLDVAKGTDGSRVAMTTN